VLVVAVVVHIVELAAARHLMVAAVVLTALFLLLLER